MNEQTRTPQERHDAPGGADAFFESPPADSQLVLVQSGIHSPWLPVANLSVGEIRRRFRDRLDIDPQSQAFINGQAVSDDTVVRAGQVLSFTRLAGAKGTDDPFSEELEFLMHESDDPEVPRVRRRSRRREPNYRGPQVIIRGDLARARLPEGDEACVPVEELFREATGFSPDTCGLVLPDGVRVVRSRGAMTIVVLERAPQVRSVLWEANPPGTAAPYQPPGYRTVQLALPYLIVVAVFLCDHDLGAVLAQGSQCYFRVAPLQSLDDGLLYPALLNCLLRRSAPGGPPVEICIPNVHNLAPVMGNDLNEAMRVGLASVLRGLLDTGFNYHGEVSGMQSGYSASRHVDPRIATVEAWEAATRQDPLFVLDVPWLPTGRSLRQVIEQTLPPEAIDHHAVRDAMSLARLVFQCAIKDQLELELPLE